MRRAPGFAITAVLTLALGIGANTAIFSLIDAVMLKLLPVQDPQELVVLTDPATASMQLGVSTGEREVLSTREFESLRDRNQVFSGVLAASSQTMRARVAIDGHGLEEINARLVSGGYFSVLGVRAIVGRTFTAADETGPNSAPYAVISYDFWQRQFGGAYAVLGGHIRYPNGELTIIGVTPPHFMGENVGDVPDFWAPLDMQPVVYPGPHLLIDDPSRTEKVMWLQVIGRLRPGVTIAQAQANTNIVFRQIVYEEFGKLALSDPTVLKQDLKLHPGAIGLSSLRGNFTDPLTVLMAVVGVVLLIACANVANLLLARATARQKEMSIRLAMGATRNRILRQFVTESLLLSAAGGATGVIFALWGVQLLTRMVESQPGSVILDVRPDWMILGFTAAISVAAGVVFGIAPAWRASRVNVGRVLKEAGRGVAGNGTAGSKRFGAGRILVVAQIALSAVLLIGAGWFVRTLQNLTNVDLGYPRERLIQVRADFAAAGYDGGRLPSAYQAVSDRLSQIPGVKSVTYSTHGFFTGGESRDDVDVEGYKPPKANEAASSTFEQVGPNYFSTVGIPILLGREIGDRDTNHSERVCVINQAFVRKFFGDQNPLGKHITDVFPETRETFTIVGVAGDALDRSLREKVAPQFYLPASQPLGVYRANLVYGLRTYGDPHILLTAARKAVLDFDPAIRVMRAGTLDEQIDTRLVNERMVAQLSAAFGALALLLAAVGLYGVLSYGVARRTNEIGIRMALGARGGKVVGMILGETAILVGIGLAIGIPVSLVCARLVESKLFGLKPTDPLIIGAALGILIAVALVAAYIPARRASRVDPLVALRYE